MHLQSSNSARKVNFGHRKHSKLIRACLPKSSPLPETSRLKTRKGILTQKAVHLRQVPGTKKSNHRNLHKGCPCFLPHVCFMLNCHVRSFQVSHDFSSHLKHHSMRRLVEHVCIFRTNLRWSLLNEAGSCRQRVISNIVVQWFIQLTNKSKACSNVVKSRFTQLSLRVDLLLNSVKERTTTFGVSLCAQSPARCKLVQLVCPYCFWRIDETPSCQNALLCRLPSKISLNASICIVRTIGM